MSSAIKLYETTEAKLYIDTLLAETEGEITPEIEQLMDEADMAFTGKVEAVAAKIRELELFADAADTEVKRIAALGKSARAQAGSLSRYLLVNMQRVDMPKVATPRFKISVRENPPKCETIIAEPGVLQALRAALALPPADETPDFADDDVAPSTAVAVSPDWEQLPVETARPASLTLDDIERLDACVIVTPERVVPESREWDRKALIALHKTHPATVAAVASITRGVRLEVK